MAIKIGGNTVIDDSRNFCNINTATATSFSGNGASVTGIEVDRILQPSTVCPADGETCVDYEAVFLRGSTFVSTVGSALCCVCFEVSECEDFSDCNVFTCELANSTVSITTGELLENRCFFYRIRYEDEDGCCSAFSNTTTFQTCPDPFADFGCPGCGGFYMGVQGSYYLIMAPTSTGATACRWKNTRLSTNTTSQTDGYLLTYTFFNNALHPAGNWTATRTIGGFCDWYWPTGGGTTFTGELGNIFPNRACFPPSDAMSGNHWVAQNAGNLCGMMFNMTNGPCNFNTTQKTNIEQVRAIRRVPF